MEIIHNNYESNNGNMKRVFCRNLISDRSGEAVRNQFTIVNVFEYTTIYSFQSYDTLCMKYDRNNGILTIFPAAFNYSRTTSKYAKKFLIDECFFSAEITKKIIETAKKESYGDDCPLILSVY